MADVLTHHCPNCGGPLTFNPTDQKFHCDYCLSIFTVADIEKFEAKNPDTTVEASSEPTSSTETTDSDMDLFSVPVAVLKLLRIILLPPPIATFVITPLSCRDV